MKNFTLLGSTSKSTLLILATVIIGLPRDHQVDVGVVPLVV